MSCNLKDRDKWDTVITVAGGIAIGTVAVAAVVAAPLEIVTTIALIGATKLALEKNRKGRKCDEEEHTHQEDS